MPDPREPGPREPGPREPDTNRPDLARDRAPKHGPTGHDDLPPKVDPAAERDPKGEHGSGEPPDDLDDGPLVAMNANWPSQG